METPFELNKLYKYDNDIFKVVEINNTYVDLECINVSNCKKGDIIKNYRKDYYTSDSWTKVEEESPVSIFDNFNIW